MSTKLLKQKLTAALEAIHADQSVLNYNLNCVV